MTKNLQFYEICFRPDKTKLVFLFRVKFIIQHSHHLELYIFLNILSNFSFCPWRKFLLHLWFNCTQLQRWPFSASFNRRNQKCDVTKSGLYRQCTKMKVLLSDLPCWQSLCYTNWIPCRESPTKKRVVGITYKVNAYRLWYEWPMFAYPWTKLVSIVKYKWLSKSLYYR